MNDDWVIENLRVTLFSPKHKERVIIQNSRDDLRISSKESEASIRQDVAAKAAVDKKAAKEAPAPEKTPERPAAPTAAAASPSPPAAPQSDAPERKNGSLQWQPTEDTGYTGFSAESRGGEFVLLKTEKSLWALYFSWGRGVHVGLGCFRELKDGRAAAQKQHDKGPLPRPDGKITPEMVEKACPAPPEPEPTTAAATTPEPASTATTPSEDTPPKPPRRARTKKPATEPESTATPEPPKPESDAPKAEDIEINPDEAKKMLGQLKGLLDQEN